MNKHELVDQALVSPVYLAGPGDPAWVTVPLTTASGWTALNQPLVPHVVLTGPSSKSELRLEPVLEGPWWHVSHRDGRTGTDWSVSFDGSTPVELIAAVTDALPHPGYPLRQPVDPYEPLRQAGWSVAGGRGTFLSPDGHVRGSRNTLAGSRSWRITAGLDEDDPLWHAFLSAGTPTVILASLFKTLASPEPARRSAEQMKGFPRRGITLEWERCPAEHVARALTERVEQLAARRAVTSPPPCPPVGEGLAPAGRRLR
ncbi:DUF317 domain-containing protein [Streptomyces sp. NRRL F-5727]|uniref:DUF317 domain-containing protein n=1 Tax=Streptomyces sp. NRRL F-5727 TaxID=1463871 RepID=UPI00068C75CF|nr:DUF317 domain-containing protein [Streptomyces sp. NRRL F-5727]